MSARRITLAISLAATIVATSAIPVSAGAYATIEPPPRQSNATGLPDGRVYEIVSPFNKYARQAGAIGEASSRGYTIASADGDAVSFGSDDGPAADVNTSGDNLEFVAQRSAEGWKSRAAMPRGLNLNSTPGLFLQELKWLYFSSDLSHLAFDIPGADVPGAPPSSEANLYLEGSDPFAEPVWLARPVGKEIDPTTSEMSLLGGSPDLSTVYFAYRESLISDLNVAGWRLYEYHDGALSYAGVLPDGSIDPSGAPPIALGTGENGGDGYYSPAATGNQVSQDGSRVFFTSPELIDRGRSGAIELYVHETEGEGEDTRYKTVLASQSQLPGHVGEPSPAGVGELAVTPPGPRQGTRTPQGRFDPLLGYASPDGSHVFFTSASRLTGEAPEGGGVYGFDVDTGVLEYVAAPGLAGIVTVTEDGSSFIFEDNAVSPTELDRWSAGPHGGSVSKIVQLPGEDACDGVSCVGPARLVDHSQVLVFSAEAPIAGFNDGGGSMQIFRYDVTSNDLSCVSCPPAGILPSGSAELSSPDENLNESESGGFGLRVVTDDRGVSADGSRVFFDSPDPLVARASNGKRNVYEWENGSVFLISSGRSTTGSLFLDSSESGGDVFFTTNDELVPGDNDGLYDIYDARIPRPGDNPPPSSVPCQGDVCQGPPSVPSLLGLPASATFDGLGNASTPATAAAVKRGPKPRVKSKARKKHPKGKRRAEKSSRRRG